MFCNRTYNNWFEFFDQLPTQEQQLSSLPSQLMVVSFSKWGLEEKEVDLLTQSYLAFCSVDLYNQNRIARAVNDEIASKSESDNPEAYTNLLDHLCVSGKDPHNKEENNDKETS